MYNYDTLQFISEQGFFERQVQPHGPIATQEELRDRKTRTEAAIALWWDARTVTVYCPFCHNTHTHSFRHFATDPVSGCLILDDRGRYTYNGPSPVRCESRVAHCDYDLRVDVKYTILFPFEADPRVHGLSFELESLPPGPTHDYKRERFRTVGLSSIQDSPSDKPANRESDEERELRRRLLQMELDEVDFNVQFETSTEEAERACKLLIFDAITGCLPEMEKIINCSSDPSRLVKLRDPDDRVSLLALATKKGHFDMVRYLAGHGADIDAADLNGRTPLMEAVLWGHVKIVDFLLRQGADKLKMDENGMQASDFAAESERNEEERHRKCQAYTEDPFVKKGHRRLIRGLLGTKPPNHHVDTITSSDLQGAYFHKDVESKSISLVLPHRGTSIATQEKTAAFLNRGPPFPVVGAKSGRSGMGHGEFGLPEAGFQMLNAAYWAHENRETLPQLIGFRFWPHKYDKFGFPGSYYASHAEAQLMSFFVRRNYVFREYLPGEEVRDDFLQLFLLQKRNRQAQIIVSSSPCPSCVKLADHISRTLDVHFEFVVLDVSRKYRCPSCNTEWEAKLEPGGSYYCLACGEKRSDWRDHVVQP